jgi:hypothetical protein
LKLLEAVEHADAQHIDVGFGDRAAAHLVIALPFTARPDLLGEVVLTDNG